MLGLSTYQQFQLVLQMGLLVVLVLRLFVAGLHRIYPVFFCFLVAEATQSIVLPWTTYGSVLYRNLYLLTAGAILSLYVLIVLELYTIVLRDLAGIANIARIYTKIALGLAITVSLLLLMLEKSPTTVVSQFVVVERSIVSSLVFFVLLITLFLIYYPIKLNRNIVVYSVGYTFYFLSTAATLLLDNMRLVNLALVNNILLTISALCFLFWVVGLSRAGEEKPVVIGHRWDRTDEVQILEQLEEINNSLLRTVRK